MKRALVPDQQILKTTTEYRISLQNMSVKYLTVKIQRQEVLCAKLKGQMLYGSQANAETIRRPILLLYGL